MIERGLAVASKLQTLTDLEYEKRRLPIRQQPPAHLLLEWQAQASHPHLATGETR